jgi:hypothetical protein
VTDADPTLDVFAAHAARKAELHAPILEKLLAGTDAGTSPRERVEKALAELGAALDALEGEPEPEVPLLDAIEAAKSARNHALIAALTGRNVQMPAGATGLDGGARSTPQRAETHEQMLARVLSSREADSGASF